MYTFTAKFNQGDNTISVYTTDDSGKQSNTVNATVKYDPNYLGLSVNSDNLVTVENTFGISGEVSEDPRHTRVYVNGVETAVNPVTGIFNESVQLMNGANPVKIVAVNGNSSEQTDVVVNCDTEAPSISFKNLTKVTNEPLMILEAVLSEPGKVEVGTNIYESYTEGNNEINIPVSLHNGENTIEFKLSDLAGNTSVREEKITFEGDEKFNSVKINEAVAYNGAPTIDGVLEDSWTLDRVISKKAAGSSSASGVFGLMSDKNYLYIGIKVFDSIVDDPMLAAATNYLADSVEFFVDPECDRKTRYADGDQQLRLGLSGLAYSATKATALSNIKTASSRFDGGYIIEAAVPCDAINLTYGHGKKFGFEIAINDSSDKDVSRDGVVSWCGDGRSYTDTSKFGTAYIGSK